jgi:peptidoglycan/xylan/chitin deacetylase (PgdA/CDA1 family)
MRMNLKIRLQTSAVNLLAASAGWLMKTRVRLRVFTFHNIGDDVDDINAVTKGRFADCLSLLQDEGYTTIRASDLASACPAMLDCERVALLTFDDGYASQRDIAAEILVQHGMTATFFAISSLVERDRLSRSFAGKKRLFLGSEDLRQMTLGGFEIGSHSHTHAKIGALTEEQIDAEMRLSKRILEEATGSGVVSFAYPFGRRGAFSPTTRAALEKNGYRAAFTQEGGGVGPATDMLELPRVNVNRFDSSASFRRKLRGYYDFLRWLKR